MIDFSQFATDCVREAILNSDRGEPRFITRFPRLLEIWGDGFLVARVEPEAASTEDAQPIFDAVIAMPLLKDCKLLCEPARCRRCGSLMIFGGCTRMVDDNTAWVAEYPQSEPI